MFELCKNFYGTSGHTDLKDAKRHPKQYHRSYCYYQVNDHYIKSKMHDIIRKQLNSECKCTDLK